MMESSVQPKTPITEDGRFRLLVEAISDYAIFMLDPTGIVISWNPGAERFKGYSASEIIGQHFSRFYSEEDRETGLPARALATAIRDGKFAAEGWRIRKDGTRFWAYVVIDPIRSSSGELIGFAEITRDLSEHKAAEEKLRLSEEQFRLLVQGVTEYAIYMLDRDGRVTSWNVGAERIKGYQRHEIVGEHFSKFYTDEARAANEPQKALDTARREGRFEKESWRVRKDGTRFWAHVVIDAIHNDDGDVIGYAKITRDITERKEAQEKLEKAREMTVQSQKMEAIGQLTGGIAPDFNHLLTAVLGSLELLRKRLPDDPKSIALLENAAQGAQRGTTLTKRMLAFARNQELEQEIIDIPQLVRGMTDLLQRSVGAPIRIETHFPLVLKPVLADANQLEMALLNLTVNARDAMPDGGEIVVAARQENVVTSSGSKLKPGTYICISVTDSGEGMDAQTMRKAVEPFFTTKGLGKGTGLGLSMVHGFAEQSGGCFILHSRKGKGTTAEIWLPIANSSTGTLSPGHPQPAPAPLVPRLTILAVDDDALVLMNTVAMLEDLGHTTFEAYSAKEALEILRREDSIDLVITDQAMPKMSGTQFAQAIKSEWPDMPVLLATGYADRVPGDEFGLPKLAKPFLQRDLAEALVRIKAQPRKGKRVVPLRTRPGPAA
jgi:PAS domain S-box-containing protein